MGNFYQDTICADPRVGSITRISDLALLEPITRAAVAAILADAEKAGTPLRVYETYRSQTRQLALFKRGVTKLSKVGVHRYGLAADLVRLVDGGLTWDADYAFLGQLCRRYGLVWGGDWGSPGTKHGFVDSVHVQRCTVPRQTELFKGLWYPEDGYDPYRDGAR